MNSKIQMKKVEWEQQKVQFTSIANASNTQLSIMIIWKFLAENILLPLNDDSNVVGVNTIGGTEFLPVSAGDFAAPEKIGGHKLMIRLYHSMKNGTMFQIIF